MLWIFSICATPVFLETLHSSKVSGREIGDEDSEDDGGGSADELLGYGLFFPTAGRPSPYVRVSHALCPR